MAQSESFYGAQSGCFLRLLGSGRLRLLRVVRGYDTPPPSGGFFSSPLGFYGCSVRAFSFGSCPPSPRHLLVEGRAQLGQVLIIPLQGFRSCSFFGVGHWDDDLGEGSCYSRHVTRRYLCERPPRRSPRRHLSTSPQGSSFTSPVGAYYDRPIVSIYTHPLLHHYP